MNSDLESNMTASEQSDSPTSDAESRRRFTRSTVVGGAVLLTLGNRAAWGAAGGKASGQVCISQNTWESFVAPGFQMSAAATEGHYDEAVQFAEYVETSGQVPKLKSKQDKYCIKLKKK